MLQDSEEIFKEEC